MIMFRIASVIALLGLTGLSACNTVSGAGADIREGGKAIEETAQKVKTGTL
jgi:predicted small secreted protein